MIQTAILGFGTVGSGVAEVLTSHAGSIAQKTHEQIGLKYILDVRDLSGSPFADKLVKDFSVIERDPEVNIVVETIGGATVARDFTVRALKAGKSVITSNKELVAQYGHELLELAKANGVSYLFEASVGGGIPIIRPMFQCLAANDILEVCGILNGTTNYILTRMIRAGLTFEAALKEAQEKGYAEHDPSADIEGLDACRKICILADLAFGRHVCPDQVPTEGITGITADDVAAAASAGKKIKLLGRAVKDETDGRVRAYVAPHLLDETHPLASVEDVFNAVAVRGDVVGDLMFHGRGAGKLPTASAVVADVMDAARHIRFPRHPEWAEGGPDAVADAARLTSRWYVRGAGPAEELAAALGGAELLTWEHDGDDCAVITAGAMSGTELDERLKGVKVLAALRLLD